MMAFADASVVLDLVEESARGARFSHIPSQGDRKWFASPLVRMECRLRAIVENDRPRLLRIDAVLSGLGNLAMVDEAFERAALVRAQTGLKAPDALHVATALAHRCAELWTAAERLAKVILSGLVVRLVA